MFGCQQVWFKPGQELRSVLKYIRSKSNKLNNCVYSAHQIYFKAQIYLRHFELNHELKQNSHYGDDGAFHSQAAQQTSGAICESVKSFKGLTQLFASGGRSSQPKSPGDRKKDELHLVTHPKQVLGQELIDNQILIPLGRKVKTW